LLQGVALSDVAQQQVSVAGETLLRWAAGPPGGRTWPLEVELPIQVHLVQLPAWVKKLPVLSALWTTHDLGRGLATDRIRRYLRLASF
jgi:hypothetical protein